MQKDKLHKLLARTGISSRRKIERKIIQGRVVVNGVVAQIGDRACITDTITIDGRIYSNYASIGVLPRVIMYHKPDGEICTMYDPKGRKLVFDSLPRLKVGRWIMIGRLDINTSGLLLFTTDGELASRLMHPFYEIEREYLVRIFGEIRDNIFHKLKDGVILEDGVSKFNQICFFGGKGMNKWYRVTLSRGRKREIRRMFDAVGVKVSRLIRVRYGDVQLPKSLISGKSKELLPKSINFLRQSVGMEYFHFPKKLTDKSSYRS